MNHHIKDIALFSAYFGFWQSVGDIYTHTSIWWSGGIQREKYGNAPGEDLVWSSHSPVRAVQRNEQWLHFYMTLLCKGDAL
jgi:hypothetical protein